jgi:D-alanine-D-alanine ligase
LPASEVAARLRRGDVRRPIEDTLPVVGTEVELVGDPDGGPARLAVRDRPGETLDLIDVVFPLLHGAYGEDGQVQALLDTVGVPYVGCGILGSAVAMDKIATKRALVAEGLPITPHVTVHEEEWAAVRDPLTLVRRLRRPWFIKPAGLGSSIGITRVVHDDDLVPAMALALQYDSWVIVEEGVNGRELECAVLGGYTPEASAVGEVTVSGGWFDYQQKYTALTDPMVVPAPLPERVTERVRRLSVQAFRAAGCWGLARVDFLYDEARNRLYVNEINTMPGFTEYSMYPKVWAAAGVSYAGIVDRLVALAHQRHASRARRAPSLSRPTPHAEPATPTR